MSVSDPQQSTRWLLGSLSRQFMFFLMAVLGIASIGFLLLFLSAYNKEMAQEREHSSRALSLLLQVSLENAMLKRDLEGLQGIVERLGLQEGVLDVVILSPDGEIRFSADPGRIGLSGADIVDTCPDCSLAGSMRGPISVFPIAGNGRTIMRTFQPVANKMICSHCHGSPDANPINGVLAVDYDLDPIEEKAWGNLQRMILAGLAMLLLATWAAWWFMRRFVLSPVESLGKASVELTAGNLGERVSLRGHDEIALLGSTFNEMAARLQQNDRALRDQERFLQEVIDGIPDGIRVIDGNYNVIKANRSYRKLIGSSSVDAVLQQTCYQSSHDRTQPCPATLFTCPLHEIREGNTALKCIQQFRSANGFEFPVEVYAAVMHGQNQTAQPVIVEAIRDLNSQIEISQEQRLSGLGEVAAGVAHEIRNPLASVRIAVQASLRSLHHGGAKSEEIVEYLDIVERQLDRCLGVTDRLIKLSAFSSHSRELVEVNVAVEETLSLLRYESEQLLIDMRLQLSSDNPRVTINDSDLRMIVLNVAQNGFHAISQGGYMVVRTVLRDDSVLIEFEDNGPGIEPQVLAKIFDPFYSARADGKRGTGLGLSIVKSLAERHHGRVDVSSSVGHGSVFQIRFPSAD